MPLASAYLRGFAVFGVETVQVTAILNLPTCKLYYTKIVVISLTTPAPVQKTLLCFAN